MQINRIFIKSFSFLAPKKAGRLSLKSSWIPSTSVQQVPQHIISKSMSPYSYSIDTSCNISIGPIGLSSVHKFFWLFSQTCICHYCCKKYSNLWYSDKSKMHLQVKCKSKNWKQTFLLPPRKALSPILIITP